MSALAYVLLPVSGIIAFFRGRTARVRAHGLQAVVLGIAWPAALYLGAALSDALTLVVFVAGSLLWATFIAAAAFGRDLFLPGLGGLLRRAAAGD